MVNILVKVNEAGNFAGIEIKQASTGESEVTQQLSPAAQLFQLPDNFFTIKNKVVKADGLDTEQAVLFFDYLRRLRIVANYENSSLAKFVHYLTGWSEKCLSMDFSSNFKELMRFKKGKPSVENLEQVREALVRLTALVDEDLARERSRLQEKKLS